MLNSELPIRKIIVLGLALIITGWGIIWIFNYLTTGTLTVNTDSPSNFVSIAPLGTSAKSSGTKTATHSLSLRVKPGQYQVSAFSKSLVTNKIVSVKARQHKKYTLNPLKPSAAESIMSATASNLAASSSQLLYVDSSTGGVMLLDGSNGPQRISPLHIKQGSIVSPSLGVVQDENNKLYRISGRVLAAVDTKGHIPNASRGNISLSSSGLLAFTSGNTVYAGRLGSLYKAAYVSGNPNVKVFAGGDNLAIIEKLAGSSKAEGENKVTVISNSGKKTSKEIGALQAGWSPSGKYLFIAGENGNYIYDSSLNLVRTLDPTVFGAFGWVNDASLAYGIGGSLWLYNVESGQAGQVTKATGDIGLISATPDTPYLYVVSGPRNSGSASQISRVGLKGQAVPTYLQTLSIFLPENVGVCSISYINFTAPTILVSYPAATTTPNFCVNAAKGELAYYDINPGKFRFQSSPALNR